MSDGLDGVVQTVTALPAIAQGLVVLHAGEGVLDAGTDLAMFSVVGLLDWQQRPAGAFAVRDHQSTAGVGTIAQHGDTLAVLRQM